MKTTIVDNQPIEDADIERLAYFKITNIGELVRTLMQNKKKIETMASIFARQGGSSSLCPGICVFYLGHVLAGQGGTAAVMSYIEAFHLGPPSEHEATVKELVEAGSA